MALACSSSARLCTASCTRTAVGAYGTGVGWSAPATMAGGVDGFPAALMSFAGRAGPVRKVAGLPEDYRLVTVTVMSRAVGGSRLAGGVARRAAGQFANGMWLAAAQDPARVAYGGCGARRRAGPRVWPPRPSAGRPA